MSNYNSLKSTIDANIKQNENQEITGQILNSVLNAMVTTLGTGYQFAGVATIATNPGTPDAKVYYIANGKGTYEKFGGLEVTEDDVVVLYWDSAWHKVATGIASQEKLSELEKGINILEIESKETQLGSLSKAISETTYLNVNCSTSYIVGQIVNVIFRSSVDCVITPYAYGSGASIYRTYSNITLIANEDKMVKMSIDEVQGYYGFGGLATKAGTYKVNVSQTITESKALSNIYVKGKMFVTNGNVVYENDVIKSCNIVWADGKSGTLINSNWDDSVLEYATTKVTYDGTTYTYNRQYSELGEVIKETIN